MSGFVRQNSSPSVFTSGDSWVILNSIEQSIKRKIEAVGTPLKDWDIKISRGILTGCNEAFIIDQQKRDELVREDIKSAEIIRPILRGRDIKRYGYDFANLYLIATFPARHYDIENFPAIKSCLLSFDKDRLINNGMSHIAVEPFLSQWCKARLEQSGETHIINGIKIKSRKKTGNKWFETQDQIGYWDDFNRQEIIYNDIAQQLTFGSSAPGMFVNNTIYFIKSKEQHIPYLLAVLNSHLIDWYYRTLSVQLGKNAVRMFSIYVEKLPIPTPHLQDIEYCITNATDSEKIEPFVFQRYGLTSEEKEFIFSSSHCL